MEGIPKEELLDAMSNLARLQCRSLAFKLGQALENLEGGNYMAAACILADVEKDFAFATSILSTAARITRTNG
jgi:hypothetical protein